MPELWLVCEGEKGSVDVAILKPVLATILAAEIVVEPAGGDRQLSTVARFLEVQRGGRAAYVKDRDYMPREAAEVALQERSPDFLLRRHSIENYLLPPQIILRAFTQLRQRFENKPEAKFHSGFPPCLLMPNRLPMDCGSVQEGEPRSRHAFSPQHRLWDALPTTVGQIQKRHPTNPQQTISVNLVHGVRPCVRKSTGVRDAAEQTSQCVQFQRENVTPYFDKAYAEITANRYVVTDGILGRLSWPRSAEGIPPVAIGPRSPPILRTSL